MSGEWNDERLARLNTLSDRVFGEAAEIKQTEAEELLRTAGIDPARLKSALYQRMLERSRKYSGTGKPPPPLLSQALQDLQPVSERSESTLTRTARLVITRLLQEIRELPKLVDAGATPAFTAAYRNKKELSGRDLRVLDQVAEDLRKRIVERKTHE